MPQNINFEKIKFPDKKFLHKTKNENVHIYNVHRILPRILEEDIFENHIIPNLNHGEREFIQKYYSKHTLRDNYEQLYILRSIPYIIPAYDFENIFINSVNSSEDYNFILGLYKKSADSNSYILSKNISTSEELRILKILFGRILLVTDTEQALLSEILEKFNLIDKENIFFSNMHVDPGHDYFFEHQLDHVPGIMLIETARQMFTACAHIYGKAPESGVSFTLNSLKISFSEYIWLSLPTKIELKMNKISYTEKGYWYNCACTVTFFQEFREKAAAEISGTIIRTESLENMIIKKHLKEAVKFNTPSGLKNISYIYDILNKDCHISKIIDISLKHILVEFNGSISFNNSKFFEFKVELEDIYTVHGECTLRSYQIIDNRCFAMFHIDQINPIDRNNLIEIIKGLAHIRERRGIL